MPAFRPEFSVSFDNPSAATDLVAGVETDVEAAAAAWSLYLVGSETLAIDVTFATLGGNTLATGGSDWSGSVGTDEGTSVYQAGLFNSLY